MYSLEDETNEVSNIDTDLLLADLPINLIKENIRAQINDPLSNTVNYIEIVIDKIRELEEMYSEDGETLNKIKGLSLDFFSSIIDDIDERFGLGVSFEESDSAVYIEELATVLYSFLIVRYKKNVRKMLYNYITENKKELVEEFDYFLKKKDVTSNSIKKKVKNKEDALIASNLPVIIKYILDLNLSPIELIEYCNSDDLYEGSYIIDLILSGNLIGDFTEEYLSIIVDEYDDVLDEIQTNIRIKLLNK